MKLKALTVDDLRSGKKTEDVPATLRDALVVAVVRHAEADMFMRRADQLTKGSKSAPPDVEEHYFVHIEPGMVPMPIMSDVLAAFVDAGWPHSTFVGHDTLVIARTPYVLRPGRAATGRDTRGSFAYPQLPTDSHTYRPVPAGQGKR